MKVKEKKVKIADLRNLWDKDGNGKVNLAELTVNLTALGFERSPEEDRELFALYIRDHPDRFNVIPIINDTDLSHHGWTVDEPEDVIFMRRIFDALYVEGRTFDMQDVLTFLESDSHGGTIDR